MAMKLKKRLKIKCRQIWYYLTHPKRLLHRIRCKLANRVVPVSKGMFCDYCTCQGCQMGERHLTSYKCLDGTNICDVCLNFDPCDLGCQGGAPDQPCRHKPATNYELSGIPPKAESCPYSVNDESEE
jgi:hypothetical protein